MAVKGSLWFVGLANHESPQTCQFYKQVHKVHGNVEVNSGGIKFPPDSTALCHGGGVMRVSMNPTNFGHKSYKLVCNLLDSLAVVRDSHKLACHNPTWFIMNFHSFPSLLSILRKNCLFGHG